MCCMRVPDHVRMAVEEQLLRSVLESRRTHRSDRPAVLNALKSGADVDCSEVQGWLYDYLKTDVDPYDFQFMVSEWVEEHPDEAAAGEYDLGTMYDDLTPDEQTNFTEWLKDKLPSLEREDALSVPAYVALHAQRKLPAGTWLVHFTNEPGGFDEFDRGTTIDGMHLSKWVSQKTFADCKVNLSTDGGIGDVVFGFAFEADSVPQHHVRAYARKYGENIVLFQCDCAVLAYHDGDQEYQAIFPICSEYNVVSLSGDGYGGFSRRPVQDGDSVEFPNFAAALAFAKSRNR